MHTALKCYYTINIQRIKVEIPLPQESTSGRRKDAVSESISLLSVSTLSIAMMTLSDRKDI